MSQLCLSTTVQDLSREVRRNRRTRISSEANWIGNFIASDMTELVVPSNNFNGIFGTVRIRTSYSSVIFTEGHTSQKLTCVYFVW